MILDQPSKNLAKVMILNEENEVLLLRRGLHGRGAGEWDLPGGKVEDGEECNDAACRETLEEAGITIQPIDIELVYTHTETDEGKVWSWLFFLATRSKETTVTLSEEHDDMAWKPITEAMKMNLFEEQEKALICLQQNILAR